MPKTMSAPPARAHRRTDLEQLQGIWKSIAGKHEARLLIAGHRFTFEFCDGQCQFYMGTFDLNPEATPPQMDMHIEEGPENYKGQLALCLYHLDGDILRWCPSKPGSTVRLTSFPSVDDHKYVSLIFKHVRPQRAH